MSRSKRHAAADPALAHLKVANWRNLLASCWFEVVRTDTCLETDRLEAAPRPVKRVTRSALHGLIRGYFEAGFYRRVGPNHLKPGAKLILSAIAM